MALERGFGQIIKVTGASLAPVFLAVHLRFKDKALLYRGKGIVGSALYVEIKCGTIQSSVTVELV